MSPVERHGAAEPGCSTDEQRHSGAEQNDRGEDEPDGDRSQQGRPHPGRQVGGDLATRVGVHHDHSPRPGPECGFDLLRTCAFCGDGPEGLAAGRLRRPRPRDGPVGGPEWREGDVDQLAVLHVAEVGRHLRRRCDADKDRFGGIGRRCPTMTRGASGRGADGNPSLMSTSRSVVVSAYELAA